MQMDAAGAPAETHVFQAEVAELLDGDSSLRRGDALALPFAVPAYRARRL